MITNIFINLVILILGAIFSFFPVVNTLPTIAGFNIDANMLLGMGYINTVFQTFWPLAYMFQAFLFLMGYYILKIIVVFFLGHRAPTSK